MCQDILQSEGEKGKLQNDMYSMIFFYLKSIYGCALKKLKDTHQAVGRIYL